MIRVISLKGKEQIGFYAKGHSGSAPSGQDIICSAVSALTQSAALALKHYNIPFRANRCDSEGILCVIAQDCETARIILESMYCGLRAIADQFPQNLKVIEIPAQEVEK